MHPYERYKANVSIVQVAESLGYVLNKKAGRNPLEFKHPERNTIVIRNLKGPQRFFTRHEPQNKGTVIDFVRHRLPLFREYYFRESEGINKILSSFSGEVYVPARSLKNEPVRKSFDVRNFDVLPAKLSDLVYLSKHRGLHDDTLSVFLPYIQLVKPSWSGSLPFNIGFPYRVPGTEGIVGFEQVNYLFKGHAKGSDKTNALWAADVAQTGSFARHIYIAESAIDAMSFYQLHLHKLPLHQATFYSTGGYVTDQQLRNLLKQHPNALIHTLFDNDLAGHLYDIRTACMKENRSLLIRKDGDTVHFSMDNKSFPLSSSRVSLTNFRQVSGLRPDIRVHKAQGKDFNEMVMSRASGMAASVRMR